MLLQMYVICINAQGGTSLLCGAHEKPVLPTGFPSWQQYAYFWHQYAGSTAVHNSVGTLT
jgi:hypothetical protein